MRTLLILLLSFLMTVSLAAEVMDKEPTLVENWLFAVVGGVLAIVVWRWRWSFGVVVTVLALAGIYAMHLEINDPSVGPHIRREAGQGYITQFYWSAAVGCVLQAIAAYAGLKHRWRRLSAAEGDN